MLEQPFKEANFIITTLKQYGFEAYYVGGCVRDYLMDIQINDIDIATSAPPEEINKIFKKVIPVGVDHGTVIVRHNHTSYEVTTFKENNNYYVKNSQKSIHDDLSMRDFTINSLAMDESGQIIDLFNGVTDINNQVIKTVGSPNERFTEDPLRIIRALRFVSQFGFSIEDRALLTMNNLKSKIAELSIERITSEMKKFFIGNYLNYGLNYLLITKVYEELPIFKNNKNLIRFLPNDIKPFNRFSEVISYFHLIDQHISINQWIKAWKVSNVVKKETINLVSAVENYKCNDINVMLLYKLDEELINSFVNVVKLYLQTEIKDETIISQKNALAISSRKDLSVDGNDITKLFPHLKQGKWIEDLLKEIEEEVLYKRITNDKNIIKDWIICNRLEIN